MIEPRENALKIHYFEDDILPRLTILKMQKLTFISILSFLSIKDFIVHKIIYICNTKII